MVDTYLAKEKFEESKKIVEETMTKLHLLGSSEATEQISKVERIMEKVEEK